MNDADVIVIGAGIVGAWVTAMISDAIPDAEVVVVDKGSVGSGASAISAGLHVSFGLSQDVRRLAAESAMHFHALLASEPGVPIHPLPLVALASCGQLASYAPLFNDGYSCSQPAWGSLGLIPGFDAASITGAHYSDVSALARRLFDRCNRRAELRVGENVVAITGRSGAPVVEFEGGAKLQARTIVVAPGPWALIAPFAGLGMNAGVRVKKVVSLTMTLHPQAGDPTIFFLEDDAFLLPRVDQQCWLFSYPCQTWDVTPDLPFHLEDEELASGRAILARYRADLLSAVDGARIFCDAYTPDRIPRVGVSPVRKDVVLIVGSGGSGHRLAPALASRAAQLVSQILH